MTYEERQALELIAGDSGRSAEERYAAVAALEGAAVPAVEVPLEPAIY